MPMQYWLVKQEPGSYSWSDLLKEGRTAWTGVRNYQARNHLRSMKRGDAVVFYHSGEDKCAVGIARVEREAYADPTADSDEWSAVDIAPVEALARPVTLSELRRDTQWKDSSLTRNPRLSVMPLSPAQHQRLLKLAGQGTA